MRSVMSEIISDGIFHWQNSRFSVFSLNRLLLFHCFVLFCFSWSVFEQSFQSLATNFRGPKLHRLSNSFYREVCIRKFSQYQTAHKWAVSSYKKFWWVLVPNQSAWCYLWSSPPSSSACCQKKWIGICKNNPLKKKIGTVNMGKQCYL